MPLQSVNVSNNPSKSSQLQSIERDRELARTITNQALQPLNAGRMAGRVFVPTQPAEGGHKIAQALAAVYGNYSTNKRAGEVEAAEKIKISEALKTYTEQMKGTPEVAESGDKNSIYTGEMPYQEGAPVVPGDPMAANNTLMNSGVPFLQKIGIKRQFPDKQEGYSLAPGAKRYGPTGSEIASNPKPAVAEKQLPIQQLNQAINALDPNDPNYAMRKSNLEGQIQKLNYMKPAASTTINTGPTGVPLTPGQKKTDELYAADFIEWKQGGFSDAQKSVTQLSEAAEALRTDDSLTGPGKSLIPDKIRAITNPKAVDIMEKVTEIVQRNLRQILGAQFTENEGKRLIARAYNMDLETKYNYPRVQKLLKQISLAAQAKQDAAEYWEANGSLQGWKGKEMTKADFDPDTLFGRAASGQIKQASAELPAGFKED